MAGADGRAGAARLSGAGSKAAAPRPKAPARRTGRRLPAPPRGVRWWAVAAVVAAVLIGLPLAHAFLGELGALLLGAFAGGFALGRATGR
jgi:hypothetical protein